MVARVAVVVFATALAAAPVIGAPRFGVEGGLRVATLTAELSVEPDDPETLINPAKAEYESGWTLGAVVEQPLAVGLALVTGLRYAEFPEDWEVRFMSPTGPFEIVTVDYRNVFQSLEVPARLEWRPAGPGTWLAGAVLEGGVAGVYLLEATQTADASSPSGAWNDVSFEGKETGRFERWDVSVGLGAGWDQALGAGVATIRFRYAHGLTDWIESDALDRFSRGFEVVAGWRR